MTSATRSATRSATGSAGGFTFIELLMTLAIMGVLAMVTVPLAQITAQRAKEHELRIALADIRRAIDAHKRAAETGRVELKVGESGYPKTLNALVEGVPDQRSPTRQLMFFLRELPRDPLHPDAATPADRTWAPRSHASPPDAPAEGEDVFDVRSRSEAVGLNGVPYKKW